LPPHISHIIHAFLRATLIHDDLLLTAAHCQEVFSDAGAVYIGGVLLSGADAIDNIAVVSEHPHQNYDDFTLENDIMLVKLAEPSAVTPAVLNFDSNLPLDGQTVTPIGFGTTSEGGVSSDVLRKVDVNVVNFDTCDAFYGGDIFDEVMLCAGVPNGGRDSCQGDSGGPLFDASGTQIGITSWGFGCAQAEFPGVYARISAFENFIKDSICSLSSNPPCDCDNSCDEPPVDGGECAPCDGLLGPGVTMNRVGFFTGLCRDRCVTNQEFWENLGWECGACEGSSTSSNRAEEKKGSSTNKANLSKPLVVSGDQAWNCYYDRTKGDYGCYYAGHDSSKSYFLAYCDEPIAANGHPTPENCDKCSLSVLPDPDKLSPGQSPTIRRFCTSCEFAANPPAGQEWAVEYDCTNRISGPYSKVNYGRSLLNTNGIF
jgi:trypsin